MTPAEEQQVLEDACTFLRSRFDNVMAVRSIVVIAETMGPDGEFSLTSLRCGGTAWTHLGMVGAADNDLRAVLREPE